MSYGGTGRRGVGGKATLDLAHVTYMVFPKCASTCPRSVPNRSVSSRRSYAARPSTRTP